MRRSILLPAWCIASTLTAQSLVNGDLSSRCDTCKTGLTHWDISWASSRVTCRAQEGALHIACLDSAKGTGFVEQSIVIPEVKEPTILTVSARIRVNELSTQGASINIACYTADGGFLTNKDQGLFWYNWVQGTRPWELRTLKLILPSGTSTVKVGAIVKGKGEAWFDDFTATFSQLADRVPDKPAIAYVNTACDSIRTHALYADSVNLDSLRTVAVKIAGGNNDPSDRHLAVEYLIQSLGDHHSFLMRPDEYASWQTEGGEAAFTHASSRVMDGYGYVLVPGFMSGDSLSMLAFADSLQRAIAHLSKQDIHGWIVDLRMNGGGNMAPMVCGLGPLLKAGVLGTLTHKNGRVEHWYYRNGECGWDDAAMMRVLRPVVLEQQLPIAVLTAQATGSSGECSTISFIGNPLTRSFGQGTWGLTTGNGQFQLPDSAQMFIASTTMGDRNGKLFRGPIVPDEVVDQPADWRYDASLDAALKWLAQQ